MLSQNFTVIDKPITTIQIIVLMSSSFSHALVVSFLIIMHPQKSFFNANRERKPIFYLENSKIKAA